MTHGSSQLQSPQDLQCKANILLHCRKTAVVGGESTPAGILDMRAMAKNPIYAALKREIAGMESTMDPRLQAKYAELHRLTLELAGG